MERWMKTARDLGFDVAEPVDTAALEFRRSIRSMCALNLCGRYGACWTCPPVCGDPETCRRNLASFSRGFLVQTRCSHGSGKLTEQWKEAGACHRQRFTALCEALYPEHPEALCLISGGCGACEKCAWPEPCPWPEKAASCLTGYGLLTSQILRAAGMETEDENTAGFTAFVLLP